MKEKSHKQLTSFNVYIYTFIQSDLQIRNATEIQKNPAYVGYVLALEQLD